MLQTYVLVVDTSEDSWHGMNPDINEIIRMYKASPDYYRVEKWTYKETESGHVLVKQEVVDVDKAG